MNSYIKLQIVSGLNRCILEYIKKIYYSVGFFDLEYTGKI